MNSAHERSIDFMISYTGKDVAWAEWIAWQLSAEGYSVFLQAWDMPPGTDFVAAMNRGTKTAQRLLAVMSTRYLGSEFAEAEWRPFFREDPSGIQSLILPIRVEPVKPEGLLAPLAYVDLFDLSHMEARAALLAAVRAKRGVPTKEPEFPGQSMTGPSFATAIPRFPGKAKQALQFPIQYKLRANEPAGLRTLSAELTEHLAERGYSEEDADCFRIALHELVINATKHVPNAHQVIIEVHEAPRQRYNHHDSLLVQVRDSGTGFEFDNMIAQLERELGSNQVEHGLLRTLRLTSTLTQETLNPHTMSFWKERVPTSTPIVFADPRVFPLVFDYRSEAIGFGPNTHTFFQFSQYLKRSDDFLAMVFDPVLRSPAKVVGVEIFGQGWTGVLEWDAVIDRLLAFIRNQPRFGRKLVLFAEAGPTDHMRLRKYCKQNSIRLFENRPAVTTFLKGLK